MDVTIKKMETGAEIRGKARVHWRAWHEAYAGIVAQDYLDKLTLERCEKMAFNWPDSTIVAKDGETVAGFVAWGEREEEAPGIGEIFALYVSREYYGTGVAQRLMQAGLEQLRDYGTVCLWVLKENKRAIRFYEKCGFHPDGTEDFHPRISAEEIRMVLKK